MNGTCITFNDDYVLSDNDEEKQQSVVASATFHEELAGQLKDISR